jgi:hypothetical protein
VTVTAPGPYEAKIPRTDAPAGGYPTAEQELANALEGQAPTLARELAGLLGPVRTVKLAQAIGRAVAVGINRRVASTGAPTPSWPTGCTGCTSCSRTGCAWSSPTALRPSAHVTTASLCTADACRVG